MADTPQQTPEWLVAFAAAADNNTREALTEAWRLGWYAGRTDGSGIPAVNPFLRVQLKTAVPTLRFDEQGRSW